MAARASSIWSSTRARPARPTPRPSCAAGWSTFLTRYEQPSVTVETNGIGKFLPGLLRRELAGAKLAVAVHEHVSTRSKQQRILDALDPLLAAGALRAHARVWDTPFVREMREWLPGSERRR